MKQNLQNNKKSVNHVPDKENLVNDKKSVTHELGEAKFSKI